MRTTSIPLLTMSLAIGFFGACGGKAENYSVGGPSAGGSSGAGGASGSPTKTCPVGGSEKMALVGAPGSEYCIDEVEVSQASYSTFIDAVAQSPQLSTSTCEVNADVSPANKMPCSFTPDKTPNHPVSCIDWCDAAAYCKWAGKRLCTSSPGATQGEWKRACTNGGTTKFPYGNQYDSQACDLNRVNNISLTDVDARSTCTGSGEYARIYNLVGSVAEWVKDDKSQCVHYGLDFNEKFASTEPCEFRVIALCTHQAPWVGIRCSADPIEAP